MYPKVTIYDQWRSRHAWSPYSIAYSRPYFLTPEKQLKCSYNVNNFVANYPSMVYMSFLAIAHRPTILANLDQLKCIFKINTAYAFEGFFSVYPLSRELQALK
jgi:hypothetical protein